MHRGWGLKPHKKKSYSQKSFAWGREGGRGRRFWLKKGRTRKRWNSERKGIFMKEGESRNQRKFYWKGQSSREGVSSWGGTGKGLWKGVVFEKEKSKGRL